MTGTSAHSAPGQAAGYFFQIERAVSRLAEADVDSLVAVEKEDDVSVHLADGGFYLEQDKHTVGDRCPFADGSCALWKTLDIWTAAAERNEMTPERCHYFLVTNVPIPHGLARTIGNADESTVEECLSELKRAAAETPPSVKPTATRVTSRDKSLLKSVLLRVQCVDSSAASAGVPLRQKTASILHLPDDVDATAVLNLLHGWVANELLTAWRDRRPGILQRRAFDRQLHRTIERFRKYKKFGLPEHLVPFAKEELQRHRKRRYVKQITIVTREVDETIDAITDFVRCSTERFRLSREGELTDDDWKAFETDLQRSWRDIFRHWNRLCGDEDEADIGYRILCATRDVGADLGGAAAHRYFVMGTYHRFSDDKTVGWHPRYQELVE